MGSFAEPPSPNLSFGEHGKNIRIDLEGSGADKHSLDLEVMKSGFESATLLSARQGAGKHPNARQLEKFQKERGLGVVIGYLVTEQWHSEGEFTHGAR